MSLKHDLKIKEEDERWVLFALQSNDDIIKNYGVQFLVDNLSRYSIIALCDYFRKVQHENETKIRN